MGNVSTAIVSYLRGLDDALVGPARARRELVREVGDHLEDAVEAYGRAGYDRPAAERQAVADFGSLDEIVPAFQTTLAVAAARRTAWLLFAVLAVQPFLWDGPIGLFATEADPGGVLYRILDVGVEWLGGLSFAVAVVLLAATGIGNPYRCAGRGVARLTSTVALVSAVSLTVTGATLALVGGVLVGKYGLLLVIFMAAPMSVLLVLGYRTRAASLLCR